MISCAMPSVRMIQEKKKQSNTDNIIFMEYPHNNLLTKTECTVLRGLAIMGIMLHNYCHWLNPVVKENEYQFLKHNVSWLSQVTTGMNSLYPAHLFSFFGHYGVAIFLFLSAYGLEMKYGQALTYSGSAIPKTGFYRFTRYHFLKLFKMMIAGFVAFTIVDAITANPWHYTFMQVIGQLGMFNNFFFYPDRNIWPGPFWFFGLMFQLYMVYWLLIYRRHWAWTAGLMVLCTAAQWLMNPEGEVLNYYRYNFMGSMLPFGLGILFARYGERVILVPKGGMVNLMCFVITLILIVSANDNFVTWTVIPALVCADAIYFIRSVEAIPSQNLSSLIISTLEWLGSISAALFVVHPVLRKIFIPISRRGDIYTGLLLYVIGSLAVAWLFREIMKKIPSPQMNVQ